MPSIHLNAEKVDMLIHKVETELNEHHRDELHQAVGYNQMYEYVHWDDTTGKMLDSAKVQAGRKKASSRGSSRTGVSTTTSRGRKPSRTLRAR